MIIPFNQPYLTSKETEYIIDAVQSKHISGNGKYTKFCHSYFEKTLAVPKCLLTTSCTDALEMCAILFDIQPGDEVIMPSYTFVSTANAFMLRGAQIKFIDSRCDHPGIDETKIEAQITEKTKAIVVVHYAGVACDMDVITAIAKKHGVFVVEDAAQAINSFYKGRPLGTFGDLATFSFHETKNISCGEGGLLVINNQSFIDRAEIIWEKGTNRNAFFRGEVDKYGWVDIGSSFLPSELNAAFLYAQLECLGEIQEKRRLIWQKYYSELKCLEAFGVLLPNIPDYASNNAHMFYMVLDSFEKRNNFLKFLQQKEVNAVFHYQSLHKSDYFLRYNKLVPLTNSDTYSQCLVRLPLFYGITKEDQTKVIQSVRGFFYK